MRQLQKIVTVVIIALIIIVVGGLIAGGWYYKHSQPEPQQGGTTDLSGGTPLPDTNSTTVTPGGSTGSAQPQAPDLNLEYTKLFLAQNAKPLQFTAVTATGVFDDIFTLYASDTMMAQKLMPNAGSYAIHAAYAELNGDQLPEIVVYEDLPGFCGSGGCPVDIYQKKGTAWKPILNTEGSGQVAVSRASTNGYLDLLISVRGDVGYMTKVERFAWDGTSYGPQETVATWNGSTFGPAQ